MAQLTETKEREAVRNAYSSARWVRQVNQMSDAQVVAIYLRLKAQGRI